MAPLSNCRNDARATPSRTRALPPCRLQISNPLSNAWLVGTGRNHAENAYLLAKLREEGRSSIPGYWINAPDGRIAGDIVVFVVRSKRGEVRRDKQVLRPVQQAGRYSVVLHREEVLPRRLWIALRPIRKAPLTETSQESTFTLKYSVGRLAISVDLRTEIVRHARSCAELGISISALDRRAVPSTPLDGFP